MEICLVELNDMRELNSVLKRLICRLFSTYTSGNHAAFQCLKHVASGILFRKDCTYSNQFPASSMYEIPTS